MKDQYKKRITSAEQRLLVNEIVNQCNAIIRTYLVNWKTIDPTWPTVEGCAYLRLSDPSQVIVERGSLEQQTNIAIAEAEQRSYNDGMNYKIVRFYIEPGITGRHNRRPEFQAMSKDIAAEKFGFVIIKELSRISREVTTWKSFFRLCIDHSCEIMIRGFPLNLNDPTQLLQLDILSAFSEFESNQTSKRLKESNFSAMKTAGKFNSTKQFLGFDPVVENGRTKVGMYQKSEEELKTVTQIMNIFVEHRSYQATLIECHQLGIINKNGKPFDRNTLIFLLRNKRYVGKWTINQKNKNKPKHKLLPYEHYAEIDLPHGCVIEASLWANVEKITLEIASRRHKELKLSRIYLLSGLLQNDDGSTYYGTAGKGETTTVWYYYNKKHKNRLHVDAVDAQAREAVTKIVSESQEMKAAIRQYMQDIDDSIKFYENQERDLKADLVHLKKEEETLNRRLDFILEGSTPVEAETFKLEYKTKKEELRLKDFDLKSKISVMEERRFAMQSAGQKKAEMIDRANHAQAVLNKENPIALKNAYRELFSKVVVKEDVLKGRVILDFILKGSEDPYTTEVVSCVGNGMVGDERLELPTLTV